MSTISVFIRDRGLVLSCELEFYEGIGLHPGGSLVRDPMNGTGCRLVLVIFLSSSFGAFLGRLDVDGTEIILLVHQACVLWLAFSFAFKHIHL